MDITENYTVIRQYEEGRGDKDPPAGGDAVPQSGKRRKGEGRTEQVKQFRK